MAQQLIKKCNHCGKEGYHEYQIDNEIPEETRFSLLCLSCGFEEECEKWM
jgi:ribosomal protein L37E